MHLSPNVKHATEITRPPDGHVALVARQRGIWDAAPRNIRSTIWPATPVDSEGHWPTRSSRKMAIKWKHHMTAANPASPRMAGPAVLMAANLKTVEASWMTVLMPGDLLKRAGRSRRSCASTEPLKPHGHHAFALLGHAVLDVLIFWSTLVAGSRRSSGSNGAEALRPMSTHAHEPPRS